MTNKMTKEELASILNGTDGDDIISDYIEIAAENNLLICYGDIENYYGAKCLRIDGIFDISNTTDIQFDKDGNTIELYENLSDEKYENAWLNRNILFPNKIDVFYQAICEIHKCYDCCEDVYYRYTTNIPHSKFDIMDNGKLWGKGIVFNKKDLK